MSLEDENRNCGCNNGCGCNSNMMPLSQENCSNEAEMPESCCEKNQIRGEMLQEIRCLEFSITELALYLDTHPEDEKAICLHKEYCKECIVLKDKYQKVFGPLTINYPCNKWRWIEEPWPWERSEF